jgi:hypothetical protein
MQQVDQRTGLILQPLVLPQMIAVDIRFVHGFAFVLRRRDDSNQLCSVSVGMQDRRLSNPRIGKLKSPVLRRAYWVRATLYPKWQA